MANVTGTGSGIVHSDRREKPSLIEKIASLIDGANHATRANSEDEKPKQGVLLMGSRYLNEVWRAFEDAGYVAIFREGEPHIPDRSTLQVIDLDAYFKGY